MKQDGEYIRDNRSPVPKDERTSMVMSSVKSKNTKPEILLRKALWKEEIKGYRLHLKELPGKPDIAFKKNKLAIFVNGCFWHRCPNCSPSVPKNNTEFWAQKFDKNTERDKNKIYLLKNAGWSVLVWSEINFDKAEWRIPAERMKMREIHIVPLSVQVLGLFKQLRVLTGNYEYIFPNRNNPRTYISENTLLYALYRMGYHSRTTAHGFRSTASTILNERGFKSDAIERQLAHGDRNKVRASYNFAQYLPERKERDCKMNCVKS